MQTNFVKINLHDIVLDKDSRLTGKVKYIDNATRTAKIEVIISKDEDAGERTTRLVETKLFNLMVVEHAKKKPSYDPNKWWSEVKRFHKAFNHPMSDKPVSISLGRGTDRNIWTAEELVEFLHASSDDKQQFDDAFNNFIIGLQNAKIKSDGEDFTVEGTERIVAQADALVDSLYFILGSFVEMGVKPDKLFEAVQAANMSKLFDTEDGKKEARYREDGKILKSPNFFQPEPALKREIERQLNQ